MIRENKPVRSAARIRRVPRPKPKLAKIPTRKPAAIVDIIHKVAVARLINTIHEPELACLSNKSD